MTLVPTTELDAINELLEAIGESPVNSVTNTGLLEADLAVSRLGKVSRQVQKAGWHWNTLDNYELVPDTDGYLNLPQATVKVDTVGKDQHRDFVYRGGRLYDREKNTFRISEAVQVSLVLLLDFEDLPEVAREYITLRAARVFQQKMFGSVELSEFDKEDERRAWAELLAAEADNADYNILRDNYAVSKIVNRNYYR